MKQDAINALHELAGEAQDNGNSSAWIARRVDLIKAVIDQLAVEPAQAVPVAWLRKNGFRFVGEIEPQDDSEIPLYTAPPAIDRETRRMVLELCDTIIHGSIYGIITKAKQIREKLEAGE